MGRRKIEIKAIKDDRNRSVTFLKRKGGLFKKAHELAVLCSVDVAVIIFGHNKKLYEFSSCDMDEALGRYQYVCLPSIHCRMLVLTVVFLKFGPPHEHKGPEDFSGKRDDDDEEDETTPAPDEAQQSHQNAPPQNAPMVPPHVPTHPGFQHVNHAPSASPPVGNGVPFVPRRGTPQSQGASRPSSRNHVRRVSSNLGPQHRATPPPHPPQNGFAYVPNPPVYNPNANPNLNQQPPRQGQFPQYRHPPPAAHHPPPQQSLPQSMPPHTVPAHSMPQHIQTAPQHMPPHPAHSHPLAQQTPPMAFSQPPHPPMPQMAPAYVSEQGRNTTPATFPPEQQNRTVPFSDAASDQIQSQHVPSQTKVEESQSPPQPMSISSKSRSIFTPIDDRGSVLARHFPIAPPVESPRSDLPVKAESTHEDSEGRSFSHPAPPAPPRYVTEPQRTQSMPTVPDIKPPARTNSGQLPSKRPQLKVQIPSESSDRGSATAESTSRDSAGKSATPAKNPDTNQSGVVLPPPSPSAGAILSAGAQGPPNPFARPPPPAAATQNNNAFNGNNNIETPISALPSRFVSDALLPSPSSFFPEWGIGRSGPDTNMLPSPLTFPTPAVQSGPGFSRDDERERKRKSPEDGSSQEGPAKRTKA
ncbi:Transcription factor [Aspergillus sp. HF37]|nr:Transcription factor [Aspergillus sp. HF37]